MLTSKLAISVLMTGAITSSTFASSIPLKIAQDPQQELNEAIADAENNRSNPQIAGEHLHKAYQIAFQMGKFPLAKKLLATSVSQGFTLEIWDHVALAEIFVREGKYKVAKERITLAIDLFKKSKCKYDASWGKIRKKLNGNNYDEVAKLFNASSTPILIQTQPTTEAIHKLDGVEFRSLDDSFPDELSVNLIIDHQGKVRCAVTDSENKKYAKMITALRNMKFKPAMNHNDPVWQYGKSFKIRFQKGKFRNDVRVSVGNGEGSLLYSN